MTTTTRASAPRKRALAGLVLTAALVLGSLAGCGGGDESGGGDEPPSELEVAQARVESAKQALQDAEDDFTATSEAFCGSSQSYVEALDRYGDVLVQTATTVGDVEEAGADLAAPQDEVEAAAQAALDAQQSVLEAEEQLAEAKAAVAAAKNPDKSPQPTPSSSSSPEPLAPPATVTRVEKAQAELTSVQEGLTADTPLSEASQQFNAAVVALEMAWLRLFAEAGCLSGEQQEQAEAAVRDYTTTLQASLQETGYYDGEVDGVYGPATVDAVQDLQDAHGLPVTGTVDKATADALEEDVAAAGGASAQEAVVTTAAVQQTLRLAGFWDGPVDGEWTPALTEALQELQTALGVKPTGTVDAATIAALEEAIAAAQAEPSEEPSTESPVPASPSSSATGRGSEEPSPEEDAT